MKIREQVEVKLPTQKAAKAIFSAINPEKRSLITERSRITQITLQKTKVMIEIEAEDLTALRASTDSKLRWLHTLSSCLSTLKEVYSKE